MICSRFSFLALVFCGTFLHLNAVFQDVNDLRKVLKMFYEMDSTPPLVIKRLESALAEGKIIYTADELKELLR